MTRGTAALLGSVVAPAAVGLAGLVFGLLNPVSICCSGRADAVTSGVLTAMGSLFVLGLPAALLGAGVGALLAMSFAEPGGAS